MLWSPSFPLLFPISHRMDAFLPLHLSIAFFASWTKTDQSRRAFVFENFFSEYETSFLPSSKLNLITFFSFFIAIILFIIPNTISTGANWGEYLGKNLILKPNFLNVCLVLSDKWIDALSRKIRHSKMFNWVHNSINLASSIKKFQKFLESVVSLVIYHIQSPLENNANNTTALSFPTY